jgi:hypothetical protein
VQAKEFGVVGDGQTDNTPTLIALRDAIRTGGDRVWRVDFEPGHYCYSDNRWANFGNRDVTLEFNHARIECFSDAFFPLGTGPLVWKTEYPATSKDVVEVGDLIESVRAVDQKGFAQTDVAALGSPVASRYRPGDRVLVAGYIQQTSDDGTLGWGWPPNFRYFEWKEVVEVMDASTLRFFDPFRFSYDAAWPDLVHPFNGLPYGAPRIFRCRLDDDRETNRSLTVRHAHFVGGRNRAAGSFTPISPRGWHVALEGCTGDEGTTCWPSEAKRITYRDCRFSGKQVELDKIVETVRFERCDFRNRVSSGGASVLDVSFRDCNFYGFVQATPRRSWRFEGACQFLNGVHLSAGLTNTPFTVEGSASNVR